MLALASPLNFHGLYRRLVWLTVVGLLAAMVVAVLPPMARPFQTSAPARDVPAPAAPAQVVPATQQLPPGLGPVLTATLAADHSMEYAATPLSASNEGWQATNPAQQFTTTFTTDGISIAPLSGSALTLRATAISTANGRTPIAAALPISSGPRVEYRHEGLTEWYINGPRGLEQGFVIAGPPTGGEQFTLGLSVVGDTPQVSGGTLAIGNLRYSDLTVTDAVGATLPAHLDVVDGMIQIAVDARGAQWPVQIDPLFSQANLTPQTPPGNTAAYFGQSTAIATANGTTTIVVGASSELIGSQDEQGAVYVFTGSGTTYTQSARLIASDGARQQHFGFSVAITISGGTTTIVVGTFNVGEAYVYTSSGGAYIEQARLFSPDPTGYTGGFGSSVAVATNGGATIIAVGDSGHAVGTVLARGSVYMFAGSGASYPLQIEFTDPNGRAGENFGTSVALLTNGGTNTLAVGIPYRFVTPSGFFQGGITVFTGSGTSYSAVDLSASDGQSNSSHLLGSAIAVGVLNGITTVAASDIPDCYPCPGAVYVFAGSGTSYTTTKLTDASGTAYDNFGRSVAVGYSYSQTLVAVGAPGKNGNTGNAADGLLLFTQTGASYTQSSLPRANGILGDRYGTSVAMLTAPPTGDPIVVGGATGNPGGALQSGTATVSSWSAQASVQATFGGGAQMVASPSGTYSGTPFHLVASVVDGNGAAILPTAVTFMVNPSGATGGLFTASDPTSTIFHTTTRDGTGGTTAGQTDKINLFPSSTAGTFTVSVTADGTALNATYALTIIPIVPTPTINAVIPVRTTSATKQSPKPNAVTPQAPGLSPAMVIIDTNKTYEIHVSGSGFVKRTYSDTDPNAGIASFFTLLPVSIQHPSIQMDTVYNSATDLSVFVTGSNMLAGLTADSTASIVVYNPPSSANGARVFSNPVTLVLAMPRTAPPGSTLSCSGAMNILAIQSDFVVPPPCQVLDAQVHPVPGI
ncbi:MAG: hypothetical protein ACYDAR_21365, partial [Thermomicrobiales bacterium]